MVASFQPLLSGTWHDIGYCLFGDDTTSTFDPSPPVPPFIPKINNKGIPLYSGVIRKQNIRHPSLSGRCIKLQGTQSSGNIRRHSGGIGSPQSLPEGQKYWKDRTGMGYGGITIPELAEHQTKLSNFVASIEYTINKWTTIPLPLSLVWKGSREADPYLRQVKWELQGEDKVTTNQYIDLRIYDILNLGFIVKE